MNMRIHQLIRDGERWQLRILHSGEPTEPSRIDSVWMSSRDGELEIKEKIGIERAVYRKQYPDKESLQSLRVPKFALADIISERKPLEVVSARVRFQIILENAFVFEISKFKTGVTERYEAPSLFVDLVQSIAFELRTNTSARERIVASEQTEKANKNFLQNEGKTTDCW